MARLATLVGWGSSRGKGTDDDGAGTPLLRPAQAGRAGAGTRLGPRRAGGAPRAQCTPVVGQPGPVPTRRQRWALGRGRHRRLGQGRHHRPGHRHSGVHLRRQVGTGPPRRTQARHHPAGDTLQVLDHRTAVVHPSRQLQEAGSTRGHQAAAGGDTAAIVPSPVQRREGGGTG